MSTPSEFFKLPILGRIRTKPIRAEWRTPGQAAQPVDFGSDEYEYIHVDMLNGTKLYICNQWHKEHKHEPLCVPAELVESDTPKKE